MTKITPVILCGGSGTRLWPRSRAVKPKPFLRLIGEETLFEQAVNRCGDSVLFAAPVVVTGTAHVEHVEAQIGGLSDTTIVVEPSAKNTAAAIALAACRLADDDIMLICPSDHHIGDRDAFVRTAVAAAALAAEGWLVSFGIEPTAPETGFGYIKRGEPLGEHGFRTASFREKPDLETAKAFLAEGVYAWNGGIFAFRVGDYMRELGAYRPDIANSARAAVAAGLADGARFYPDANIFGGIVGESIDYAVMERTDSAAMVLADMAWSDIGNWHALHSVRPQDEKGNAVAGTVELVDCRNVLVDSDGPRVSVIGLSDIMVVVDGNDVLITSAAGTQKVGKLLGAVNQ
ncbi:sugar phosphate nucleotidyltransferase [Sphingobium sp. CR2-8]|uniref:mannose-1-phosphate guanylyltransferase n=1 Tax=Sphingobium sp. CR2-8 TaxID=1306534 RepID=UPI002DBF4E9F|nr:sugar phosphate nucleotidyltransferase [Sphingobium sp. CR2-8]MEC3912774.1 sugar phosphate nucleotidyltransferase [Sphingobium sp. CR2-8]